MFTMTSIQTAIFILQIIGGSQAGIVSVCDLVRPENFLNQRISIRGPVLFTMHGIFLLSDSCTNGQRQDAIILTPKSYKTPEVDFDLDAGAPELLRPFIVGPADHTKTACATLTGQIFYKKYSPQAFWSGATGRWFRSAR